MILNHNLNHKLVALFYLKINLLFLILQNSIVVLYKIIQLPRIDRFIKFIFVFILNNNFLKELALIHQPRCPSAAKTPGILEFTMLM